MAIRPHQALGMKYTDQSKTFKKLASILLAIALANNVFPVPGGP